MNMNLQYIWYTETGEEQYFLLEKDPHELDNLIGVADVTERVEELRNLLIKELQDRPEGFTDGTSLIPGKAYPPTLDFLKS